MTSKQSFWSARIKIFDTIQKTISAKMTIDNIQTTEITSLPFKVVSLRKTLKRDTERAKHLSMQRHSR